MSAYIHVSPPTEFETLRVFERSGDLKATFRLTPAEVYMMERLKIIRKKPGDTEYSVDAPYRRLTNFLGRP